MKTNNIKKNRNYEKEIAEAKNRNELMVVIIAFSQDETLAWSTFRKYHDKAQLRLITEFNKD